MKQKNCLIKLSLFILLSLSMQLLNSCNSGSKSNKSEKEQEKINQLDTSIVISNSITEFLPLKVQKHDDINKFLNSYVEVCDKFYTHFYDNLNNQATLQEDLAEMDEANKDEKDVIKSFKKTFKSFKSLKKTTTGAVKTVWSGMGLLTLDDKKKELTAKYSKEVLDSFHFVEKAIDKYLYYSYSNPYAVEMEKIKSKTSIRILPSTFTKDQKKELQISKTLDNFIDLQKEGNEIRKLLVFNKMGGREYPELIKSQITDIYTFWESANLSYKNETKLFNSFATKLVDLKTDIKEKKDFLKENKNDWSATAISDLESVIARYEEAVKKEINSLDINKLPEVSWSMFEDAKQRK